MNPEVYIKMAETEYSHWWFSGRRAILDAMIETLSLPKNAKILEVGCGTGGNLRMLDRFGNVNAFEMDANALGIASTKTNSFYDIRAGHCPDQIPFSDQSFDLICLFDVLEHIEQDAQTLIAIKQLLAKNGHILLTVPAYQWLWGQHDEFHHHKRRYSVSVLRQKIAVAELVPVKVSYFNSILFPLAVLVRIKEKLFASGSMAGIDIPWAPINRVLKIIFGVERFLLPRFNLPFGVSLLCVLKAHVEK